jgi:hypothetical protein
MNALRMHCESNVIRLANSWRTQDYGSVSSAAVETSRRIMTVEESVFPSRNQGAGTQDTALNGTLTVTETGSPLWASVNGLGLTATVDPGTDDAER